MLCKVLVDSDIGSASLLVFDIFCMIHGIIIKAIQEN